MMRTSSVRNMLAGVALAATLGFGGAGAALAQDTAPAEEYPVHILEGTCADLSPTSVVELENLLPMGVDRDDDDAELKGEMRGTLTVGTITTSESEDIEFEWDTMLGGPHAILVYASPADMESFVACGDIGGLVYDDDDKLVVGIHPVGDSGYSGMAFMEKDDDGQVDIEVFLSSPASTEGDSGTSVVATPAN